MEVAHGSLRLRRRGKRFRQPLTVERIASSAAVSASECLRCFRGTIGISPIQYMKALRLQKAAELLRQSDLSIAAIGDLGGFQDMSYFSKAFLGSAGSTPSEYRRQNRQSTPRPGDGQGTARR